MRPKDYSLRKVSKEAGCKEVVGTRRVFRESSKKDILSSFSIVQGKHNPRSQDHCRKLATLAPDEVTGPVRSLATSYFCGAPGTGMYVLSKVNETSWYGLRCTEETLNMHVKSSAPTLKAKKKTMIRTKRKHFHNGSMWSSGGADKVELSCITSRQKEDLERSSQSRRLPTTPGSPFLPRLVHIPVGFTGEVNCVGC